MKELQNKFNEHSEQWDEAVKCLSSIDSLVSLAKVSCRGGMKERAESMKISNWNLGSTMCRPVFVTTENQTDKSAGGNMISLTQSVHPCIVPMYVTLVHPLSLLYSLMNRSGGDVVPNDIKLGDGAASVMVLTGPNMYGRHALIIFIPKFIL